MIDKKLIEECREGNLHSFRRLTEATTPFAYSVAFRMIGDYDQAKDIVQETMITVWRKLKNIRSVDMYKTWVYRVVINKCYDLLRKRKRNMEIMTDDVTWAYLSDTLSSGVVQELENNELARLINLMTERLSPKQKAVFVLSELEDMSHDEISEITGMSKSGIKANLYYARKNISEMAEKYLQI